MRNVLALTARNLLLFVRDPLNVFFSLLGALIVFGLYTLFLGDLQVGSVQASTPGADPEAVKQFVDAWMFAGIISITTMTTPLGALSIFVEDGATKRFQDFLVSPMRRGQLVLGYLLSSFAIGLGMSVIVFAVALIYLWLVSGLLLSIASIVMALVWIVLSVAGFAALWSFIVSFIRTNGAFAAMSTIIGTIAGFVSGSYIAVGLFPEGVRNVISALPFAHSSMLLRKEFTDGPAEAMVGGHTEALDIIDAVFGITLYVDEWEVPVWFAAALLGALAVVFTWLGSVRIRTRIR